MNEMTGLPPSASRKIPGWQWCVLGVFVAVAFFPVIVEMVAYWIENPDYSHGFAIPFLTLFLIYRKRGELVREPLVSSTEGGIALGASLLFYVVSFVGGIVSAQRLALVFTLHAMVWFNTGWLRYKKMAVPMLFLFLMIPIPVTLHTMVAFPMQLLATDMAEKLLVWSHVPVLQRGNILHFPNGALEVVEACSGIRSLLAFFTLGAFVAYWNKDRLWKSSLLILSTAPIALSANILRIATSGWIGFVYGMNVAQGFLHELSGMLLFLLGVRRLFIRIPRAGQFLASVSKGRRLMNRSVWITACLLLGALVAVMAASARGSYRVSETRLDLLPFELAGVSGQTQEFDQRVYQALAADKNVSRVYLSPSGEKTWLYIGYYGTAKGGRAKHQPRYCYPGSGWDILEMGTEKISFRGRPVSVNRIVVQQGNLRDVALYWNQNRQGDVTNSGWLLNWRRFVHRLRGTRDDGAFVRVSAPVAPDEKLGAVIDREKQFAELLFVELEKAWPVEERTTLVGPTTFFQRYWSAGRISPAR